MITHDDDNATIAQSHDNVPAPPDATALHYWIQRAGGLPALQAVKAQLNHGEWSPWLAENFKV